MGKRKHKRESAQLYEQIWQTAVQSLPAADNGRQNHREVPHAAKVLACSNELSGLAALPERRELTKMKKFRFQLLHEWLLAHLEPCRVADVGGGKGLLTYLLQQSGWAATVIDPVKQALPSKYKELRTNKQVRIAASEQVPRLDSKFEPSMARNFDLLVAMHAHGCNVQLIDTAVKFDYALILLPCCVIDEPVLPPSGVHWIQWLVEYALAKGFTVEPFRLNFKGQNIGLYARKKS